MADGPYRERKEIENEIASFVSQHGAVFKAASWKISALFEASCCNQVIGWYVRNGYSVGVAQLDSKTGDFKYKVSPAGYPTTFSYFILTSGASNFELRMNTAVQTAIDPGTAITPDLIVVEPGGVVAVRDRDYFRGTRDYFHVLSVKTVSFFECKHMNAFPELFSSFLGMALQLRPECVAAPSFDPGKGKHLAPGLLVSGSGTGFMASRVGRSLMSRYCINISTAMFKNKDSLLGQKNDFGAEWRVFGRIPHPIAAAAPLSTSTAPPLSATPNFAFDDADIPF